ncbi:lanthionine synthetase LanC family protein [Bacteroides congonensis]|uniref:lanthionine synthetase LanC family protein n=1 Tax=Bacteroides congonensis TaxID=1871006 RepID=UPI00189B3DA2|nr:lanthionine synthetase LanC family protein [Bacteroides congonensis]
MEKDELKRTMVQLDRIIMSMDMKRFPMELFNGQMGICIYFFYLARLQNNLEYRAFAEKLLQQIFASASDISVINFPVGLSGIGWGIHHLLEEGFVTGSFDEVLQDVDDVLFRTVHFEWLDDKKRKKSDFIWLLLYYADRLRTMKNKEEKKLAQKTVVRILNHIEDSYSETPWEQPAIFNLEKYDLAFYLMVLGKLYELGFYNDKIMRIWEGLANAVLSSTPLLHANRLFLLAGIQCVLKHVLIPQWEQHAKLLESNIDYDEILNREFLNKNITLRRGVAGCCLLLSIVGNISEEQRSGILHKIELSDIWEERFSPVSGAIGGNVGLVDGTVGVSLIYNILLNS